MDRKLFLQTSAAALEHLDEVLGDLEHERLDVNLAGDVLTLTFDDGAQFVINAHSAAGQVWMAANKTAWHFDLSPPEPGGKWVASKNGDELMGTVARVVGDKLGLTVEL